MNNEQQFITTEQTTNNDYIASEDKPIYTKSGIVYIPPEAKAVDNLLEDDVAKIYNDNIKDIYGDAVPEVSTKEDVMSLNQALDDSGRRNTELQNVEAVMDLAERGVPASDMFRLVQNTRLTGYAFGAGLYEQLKQSNVLSSIDNNLVLHGAYMDTKNGDSQLFDALQNVPVNLKALSDMEVKATAKNNERGIIKRMALGVSTLIPFDQERVAFFNYSNIIRDHLGDYKEVKELSKLKDWNVNDLFTAARGALQRAATQSPEKFKQILNDIDEDLLSQNITLGDRATFWQQVNDTTYALNRFAFGADIAGLGFVAKTAGKTAKMAKIMGSTSMQSGLLATREVVDNVVPITSAYRGITRGGKLSWQLLTGKRKEVLEKIRALADGATEAAKVDPSAYSEALQVQAEPFLRNTIPDAYSPNGIKSSVKADTEVSDAVANAAWGIEEAEDIREAVNLAKVSDTTQIKTLIKDTQKGAINDFLFNLQEQNVLPKNRTNSINILNDEDGFRVQTKIGAGPDANIPFASREDAQFYAKRFAEQTGMYDGFGTITKADVAVDDNGAWIVLSRKFKNGDKPAMMSDLVKTALSRSELAKHPSKQFSKSVVSNLVGANLSADYLTRVLNNLKQADEGKMLLALRPEFNAIKKVGMESYVLDALMEETRKSGKWFTAQYLRDNGISEEVINGYRAVRRLDDAQYLTTAKAVYEGMQENGIKNVTFQGKRIALGKEIAKPTDRSSFSLLIALQEDGDELIPRMVSKNADELKPSEYAFVFTTGPLQDGADSVVAIKRTDLLMRDPDVMNTIFSYKPGRMQFSPNTGFVKQVSLGKVKKMVDGKEVEETIVNGINTIFAHPNRFRTQEAADTLEGFRKIAIKVSDGTMTMPEAQIAIRSVKGWENVGDFSKFYALTQKGADGSPAMISLDPRAEFKFARDGEELMFEGLPVKDFNYKGASATQYTNNIHVLNKKMRSDSDILNPFNFGDAPRLNFNEEASLATGKILRYATVDQYSRLYAQDFKEAFGLYLNKNKSALGNLVSPIENRNQIPEDVLQRMDNARTNYLRMMGRPTDNDLLLERLVGNIVDGLFPDLKKASYSRLELYKDLASGNPIRAAKAMTFHWYLGLWNPRQLWVQASASFNAIAMSPMAGLWSVERHLPIVSYIQTGDKGAMYKMAKGFEGSKHELTEVAEIAKKLDVYAQSSHAGAFERTVKGQLKAGKLSLLDPTFFYLTGEYMNRSLTAIIAAREAYLKGFRASTMTSADIANLIVRQQNLYMNMGRAGTSEWQRGFASFLTQFKGYQFRYLESMMDKTLTAGEKARLLLGQAIFGGTKGFIGPRYGAKIYNAMTDHDGADHPYADFAYHGLVDYFMLQSGSNVSFNDAFDLGLGQILDLALDGSFVSMPPAASALSKGASVITSTFESIVNYFRAPIQEREFTAYMSMLAKDVSQGRGLPSSMNNALIGYLMFKEGKERMANGALSREGITALEASMKALGFSSLSSDIDMIVNQELDDLDKDEAKLTKTARRLANNMVNASSDYERELWAAELRGFTQTLWKERPELANKLERKIWNPQYLYDLTTEQRLNMYKTLMKKGLYEEARSYMQKAFEESKVKKNGSNKLQ